MEITNPPPKPRNWLVESILVTILCCIPFGIVGIVNAANVNSKYLAGDYEGALRASKDAALWTKLGFWIGFAIILANFILFIMGLGVGGYFLFKEYPW